MRFDDEDPGRFVDWSVPVVAVIVFVVAMIALWLAKAPA